jgi:hypothetical protein
MMKTLSSTRQVAAGAARKTKRRAWLVFVKTNSNFDFPEGKRLWVNFIEDAIAETYEKYESRNGSAA